MSIVSETETQSYLLHSFTLLLSSSLSGKSHSVFTGVAIVLCHEKESKSRLNDACIFYFLKVQRDDYDYSNVKV